MDAKTRFTTFGIGALVGVLVLWGLNQKADPARERRRQIMASLSLPGMYYDHATLRQPLFGHFVLAERRSPSPGGGTRREILTGGRNRFDAEGRALPTDLLLVTETYAAGVEPAEAAALADIAFAYADRAEVTFAGPAPAGWTWDARLEAEAVAPDRWRLRLRGAAAARGEAGFALVDAVRALDGKAPVVSARLGAIDWREEAGRIREFNGE